jgi:hypothetical protein
VKLFLEYANNPSSWKPPSRDTSRREKPEAGKTEDDGEQITTGDRRATGAATSSPPIGAGLVEYPFPLREGRLAYLRLPVDLKLAEVKRLTAYLNTLVVDGEVG